MPASIKVGPFTYSLYIGGDEFDGARLKSGDPDGTLIGYCDNTALVISVKAGLHPDARREVVLHETLHACYNAVGQPLAGMDRSEVEENAVSTLAPGLLGVLRENPALVAFLVKG